MGHLCDPAKFEFTPGMPEAIKLLNDAGWLVVVVTNQAGIGRGKYTEAEFEAFSEWIDDRLAEGGAHVDAVYHCPHHPTAGLGDYRGGVRVPDGAPPPWPGRGGGRSPRAPRRCAGPAPRGS